MKYYRKDDITFKEVNKQLMEALKIKVSFLFYKCNLDHSC